LYINDVLKNTVTSAPFDIIWKTWGNNVGEYTLKAVAVDKGGKTNENKVKIFLKEGVIFNNLLYDMDFGYLTNQTPANTSNFSLDITLYSNTVVTQNYGNGLKIKCFSSDKYLASGTYLFDPASTKSLNTFNYSDYFINCNVSTKIGVASGKIGEGYTLIDKSGTTYKVFIAGKNTMNEPIKCYYEGNLIYEGK